MPAQRPIRHPITELQIGAAQPIPAGELLEVPIQIEGRPEGTRWALSAKVSGQTDVVSGEQLIRYRQDGSRWKTFGQVNVDQAPPSGGTSTISSGDLKNPLPD